MRLEVQQIEKGTEVTFTMGYGSWYKGSYLGLDYLGQGRIPSHRVIIQAQSGTDSGFKIGESYYLNAKAILGLDGMYPGVELHTE